MAGREDTAAPVSTGAACLLTPQRELRRESPFLKVPEGQGTQDVLCAASAMVSPMGHAARQGAAPAELTSAPGHSWQVPGDVAPLAPL